MGCKNGQLKCYEICLLLCCEICLFTDWAQWKVDMDSAKFLALKVDDNQDKQSKVQQN
jgi:hypothetical protein